MQAFTLLVVMLQGRLKVRDPRHFDPCSMRRKPDIGGMPGGKGIGGTIGNDTTGSGEGTARDVAGVTLLLGRTVGGDTGGGEPDGKEKVEKQAYRTVVCP